MRLAGERAQLPAEEDWPQVVESSDSAWNQTIKALKHGHIELVQAIAQVDESRLDEPIVEGLSSIYATLHGIIQHSLYHAGQIALLKKVTEDEE